MLCELKRTYGKTLRDVIEYSTLRFTHWNVPTGKDSVVKALTEYTNGTAKGGNSVQELVEIVKARQAAGKAVLIWAHKASMGCNNIPQALEAALQKGGVDTMKMINNPNSRGGKESVPQVRVENYGQHDATNKYSYCNVVILFGVQRRQLGDISAAILGVDRELGAKLKYAEVYAARVGESAVVSQQAIGRGVSRVTLNGIAGEQETILFYEDTADFNLTERLVDIYPGAKWDEYQPRFAKESKGLVSRWAPIVLKHANESGRERISSRDLKAGVDANVCGHSWSDILDEVCRLSAVGHKEYSLVSDLPYRASPWIREGRSLVRATAERYGFKDETVAAA
jgi:hypothetical protein